MFHTLGFLVVFLTVGVGRADVVLPDLVKVDVQESYLPGGYDSNDRVQVAVEGYLPNTCYKTGPISVNVNAQARTIEIVHLAYKYSGLCLQMPVQFSKVVDFGVLNPDDYTVVNGSGKEMGRISIKGATVSSADDYLYAPVESASVTFGENQKRVVTIEGSFTDSCMSMKEIRIFTDGSKVVTVLPISEKHDRAQCVTGQFPFHHVVNMPPLFNGRYLLNVRSLNGEGVFKFFDVN